jgi:hypothetical protein
MTRFGYDSSRSCTLTVELATASDYLAAISIRHIPTGNPARPRATLFILTSPPYGKLFPHERLFSQTEQVVPMPSEEQFL